MIQYQVPVTEVEEGAEDAQKTVINQSSTPQVSLHIPNG